MHVVSEIIGNYEVLIDLVQENLRRLDIDITDKQIDHIAYRASSNKDYNRLKSDLIEEHGSLLVEKIIRNRRVCIIKLEKPIKYKRFSVPCVEILAPAKGDRAFKRQLEHIEVVIDKPLPDFASRYPKAQFMTKNMNKEINPELILVFPNDANVKFHPSSIEEVIKKEEG